MGEGEERHLLAMAQAVAHRGPDGEGFYFDQAAGVGLVHRRLSIIDPSDAGSQPMVSCSGRYRVVFNGEIYNFQELAQDLAHAGYHFNPCSDTAVLGPLYDRYGMQSFSKLNGIFTFAIWDAREKELIVVRDAFGVKPLYYSEAGRTLAFASELKALLSFASTGWRVDETAMLDYLVRLWSPGQRTPSRDVNKLLPGHYIRARRGRVEIIQWYSPPLASRGIHWGRRKPCDAILTSFDHAVSSQCISDVPIGAFLSGGVDSSAIVASMVATGNRPERAYCIGFDGPSMKDEGFGDDVSHARGLAHALGIHLTEIHVGEPEPAELIGLPLMLDEPQADPAALYVASIAKAARKDGIKVLLGGAGGDDIFSGYRRHKLAALRSMLGPLSSMVPASYLARLTGVAPFRRRLAKLGYVLQGNDNEFLMKAFEFNRRDKALALLSRDAVAEISRSGGGYLEEAAALSRGSSLLDRMLHLELHGFLPDHNLNYTDKAAMAHGVEVRVPFLDTQLVELASGLPWQLKTRGFDEKWIFKRAMANRLPRSILQRKKTGFGAPVRTWFNRGKIRELAADVFASQRFRDRGLFVPEAAQRALRQLQSPGQDGAYLVLAVMMVEFWMQHFIDGRLTPPASASQPLISVP